MHRLKIVIVSPALADANNGNWQTARRWKNLLAPHAVRICWCNADQIKPSRTACWHT